MLYQPCPVPGGRRMLGGTAEANLTRRCRLSGHAPQPRAVDRRESLAARLIWRGFPGFSLAALRVNPSSCSRPCAFLPPPCRGREADRMPGSRSRKRPRTRREYNGPADGGPLPAGIKSWTKRVGELRSISTPFRPVRHRAGRSRMVVAVAKRPRLGPEFSASRRMWQKSHAGACRCETICEPRSDPRSGFAKATAGLCSRNGMLMTRP